MQFWCLARLKKVKCCVPQTLSYVTCGTKYCVYILGFGFLQAHNALLAEEEATALSVWTVACICGSLRLENVRMYFVEGIMEWFFYRKKSYRLNWISMHEFE